MAEDDYRTRRANRHRSQSRCVPRTRRAYRARSILPALAQRIASPLDQAQNQTMDAKTVALAGGSGFIGRAIARRLLAGGGIKVRVLTRNPEKARAASDLPGVEFVRADISQPASLKDALLGADTIVD